MHYHCEVIMPKSSNIEKSLEEIFAPFSEYVEENEDHSGCSFWDWHVVGGRWAGTKETCTYDPKKLEQFYIDLKELGITVSGFTAGKQEISPPSQIPMVDKLWNDLFPTEKGEITPCPLFKHSNDQYDGNDLISCDICRVDEIPEELKCSRVIIAGINYDETRMTAKFMLSESIWNGVNHMPIEWDGVNHMPIEWDGKVKTAIDSYVKEIRNYKEEYVKKNTPMPDWICITVDYHS